MCEFNGKDTPDSEVKVRQNLHAHANQERQYVPSLTP
jgi:hypothetical protein